VYHQFHVDGGKIPLGSAVSALTLCFGSIIAGAQARFESAVTIPPAFFFTTERSHTDWPIGMTAFLRKTAAQI